MGFVISLFKMSETDGITEIMVSKIRMVKWQLLQKRALVIADETYCRCTYSYINKSIKDELIIVLMKWPAGAKRYI